MLYLQVAVFIGAGAVAVLGAFHAAVYGGVAYLGAVAVSGAGCSHASETQGGDCRKFIGGAAPAAVGRGVGAGFGGEREALNTRR